ncbi:MAG TPA: DUF305 domain-containing protein [Longimicrobiales bacterium]|nr:DUF305 domain-containing protein [Longimicrobiales bacterium]
MATKALSGRSMLAAVLLSLSLPLAARAQAPVAPIQKYTRADVDFMTGMIGHHAQAIVMARMAPTHGASPDIQILCGRVINAQKDEIALMQRWLRQRNLEVPEPKVDDEHAGHDMGAMAGMHAHEHLMPAMLTDEQMKQLDAARGKDFDMLFLKLMIQHHQGATAMVKELFAREGAAQDDTVFKLASDVNVDQTTEIARMTRMLMDLLFGKDD